MTERQTTPAQEAHQIMRLAGSALQKIDQGGARGISMVTFAEIDAIATLLVIQSAELEQLRTKLEGVTQ